MLASRVLIASLCAIGCAAVSNEALANHSFVGYMAAFGKSYMKGSAEHLLREGIFNERLRDIVTHNSADHSWKMGLNEFTDWTQDELKSLRGYRKQHTGYSMPSSEGSSVVQLGNSGDEAPKSSDLMTTLDWSNQIAGAHEVMSQGACGSCWAVAAAGAITLHATKRFPKFNKVLSPENINKCAPNPMSCGGTGGCQGSTPGLALKFVKSLGAAGGLYPTDVLPYTASTGSTIPEDSCAKGSFLQTNLRANPLKPAVSMLDYVTVEPNNAERVMDALVTEGPLAVAVVGSGIQEYSSGVFDGCKNNFVIDHAVLMMGFGEDNGKKYWTIRNSWGKGWGEHGFFRLQRHFAKGAATQEPCGWDEDPGKGVACKDAKGEYPKKTWVCGVCGIVSDVAYPTKINVPDVLLS